MPGREWLDDTVFDNAKAFDRAQRPETGAGRRLLTGVRPSSGQRPGLCSGWAVFLEAAFRLLAFIGARSAMQLHAEGLAPPAIEFTNVTASGSIKFVHCNGSNGMAIIREIFGPGVCVADF